MGYGVQHRGEYAADERLDEPGAPGRDVTEARRDRHADARRDRPAQHEDRPARHEDLEPVWRALSNAVRRAILDALMEGPLTTGALDERFPDLSRFAVMQHLEVLEEADLVVPVRDGRHRYNYLNPVPIQRIYDRWVSRYMKPWTDALTSLKHELESAEDRSA